MKKGSGLWLQPRETWWVLEQQRAEPAFGEPEQQHSIQSEQHFGFPAGSPLAPRNARQPRNKPLPAGFTSRENEMRFPVGTVEATMWQTTGTPESVFLPGVRVVCVVSG
jgi:hypothetical protein